jgi:hypothetical protein
VEEAGRRTDLKKLVKRNERGRSYAVPAKLSRLMARLEEAVADVTRAVAILRALTSRGGASLLIGG